MTPNPQLVQFSPLPATISMVQSLTPHEWGLPPEFNTWRPNQPRVVASAVDSPTRHHVNCVPTGGGKSPAYVTHAVMSGLRTVILTSTLGLQTQNLTDFSSIGMVDIRGRSNYKCLGYTYLNCDEGHPKCHVCREGKCPRDLALKAAMDSPLVITNYPFWLSNNKYGDGLGNVDMLVLDEAHDAVDQLANFMSVTLSIEDLSRSWKFITRMARGTNAEPVDNDLAVPDGDDISTWSAWSRSTLRPYEKFISACSPPPDSPGLAPEIELPAHETVLRDFSLTKRVRSSLTTISQSRPDTWVCELVDAGAKFDPIWPSMYNEHLFSTVKKIAFYSATILPKTMALLGVPRDSYTFSEFDSGFDPRRSPIYFLPTVNMNHRASDADRMQSINRLDQIVGLRLDRKGFVPTGSFDRQRLVVDHSTYRRYMHYNSSSMTRAIDGKTITKIVDQYRASPPPAILVTPSASTGYDFRGPDCRYIVMIKVPFPDTRSKVMQRRKESDPEYYNYLTMLDLIQTFGRGTRSPSDWCENFAIDNNYQWFMNRNQHHAPQWFKRQALIGGYVPRADTMPQPLPLNF